MTEEIKRCKVNSSEVKDSMKEYMNNKINYINEDIKMGELLGKG